MSVPEQVTVSPGIGVAVEHCASGLPMGAKNAMPAVETPTNAVLDSR